MKRSFAVAVLAGTALLLGATTALAAQSTLSVSPSVVGPGGTVHISGSIPVRKCPASEPATVTGTDSLFPPDGFGPDADRDAQGAFSIDYTVPTSTAPGRYELGLRCGGGNVGVSAVLTVSTPSGAPQTGAGGTAPRSSLPWTVAGLASLVVAGVALGERRRRTRAS